MGWGNPALILVELSRELAVLTPAYMSNTWVRRSLERRTYFGFYNLFPGRQRQGLQVVNEMRAGVLERVSHRIDRDTAK